MLRFEYKIVSADFDYFTDEGLNALGDQGWELVCEFEGKLIFKKEFIRHTDIME